MERIESCTNDSAKIKFGTDGWRGIIADDFTFENVRRVAGAIASYVLKHEDASQRACLSATTRASVRRVSHAGCREVIADAGFPCSSLTTTFLRRRFLTAVKQLGAAGGVVITSSHNPWNWNGVKFKEKFGGSAHARHHEGD